MKNKEKIIIGIIVVFLVIGIICLFLKVFKFEDSSRVSSYSDEYVDEIYNDIIVDKYYSRYTLYSGFYTTYGNLAKEYIASYVYWYLESNKLITLNNYDKEELMNVANFKETDFIPITKIPKDTFDKTLRELFGSNAKLDIEYFSITPSLKCQYDSSSNNYYIYDNNTQVEDKYYVYRERESFEVRDNKETIIIYDYYVKCDLETNECFNDDRMAMPNKIKLENGKIKTKDKEKLVKYKHVFKLQNHKFYWVSSEIIEN